MLKLVQTFLKKCVLKLITIQRAKQIAVAIIKLQGALIDCTCARVPQLAKPALHDHLKELFLNQPKWNMSAINR